MKGGNTVQPFLNLELIKEVWGLIKWGSIEKDPGDTKLEKLENVGHKVGDNYRKSDIIVVNRSGLEENPAWIKNGSKQVPAGKNIIMKSNCCKI